MSINLRLALWTVIAVEVLVALLAVVNFGIDITALQAVVRFSGRVSLGIFSIIFLFHGQPRFSPSQLLSEKYFLVFAVAHGIHLAELASYIYLAAAPLNPVRQAGGALAYLMIFSLPVLLNMKEKGKLPDLAMRRAELIYLFYIWLVFFLTYLPRVQGKLPQAGGSYAEHVGLLAWVCMMLGIRVSRYLLKKTPQRIR